MKDKDIGSYPNVDYETFLVFVQKTQAILDVLSEMTLQAYAKSFGISEKDASREYNDRYSKALASHSRDVGGQG